MKVIELLNKIANGEEAPKKIKYEDNIFIAKGNGISGFVDYVCEEIDYCFSHYIDWDNLNDEVEIIEEDKSIEKLENEKQFYSYRKYADIKNDIGKILYILKGLNLTEEKIDNLNNKINELIDKINKEK